MQFSRTSPQKSGESSEKSSGENRVKSCHVCGCHGFFGPEKQSTFTLALFKCLNYECNDVAAQGRVFSASLSVRQAEQASLLHQQMDSHMATAVPFSGQLALSLAAQNDAAIFSVRPDFVVSQFHGSDAAPFARTFSLPSNLQKNHRALSTQNWHSPPPCAPPNLQKEQKMPGAHKIGAAISGPRVAGGFLF